MISKSERAYFNAARDISKLSDHRQQLGCVVVNNHHIISSGHNSATKCHRIQAQLDKQFFGDECCLGPIHAELDALRPLIKSKADLTTSTIYVYREHRNGGTAMARPCPRCFQLIKSCGIKKIKYTTEEGFASESIERT